MKLRWGTIAAVGILFGLLVGRSLLVKDNDSIILARQPEQAAINQAVERLKHDALDLLSRLSARSALSVFVDGSGRETIWYEKDAREQLLFASLAKLLTALVVANHYNLNEAVTISKHAVETPESAGELVVGERYAVGDLLYPLLIESSNDAATALAEVMGQNEFIGLMQTEAERLGMHDTLIQNPTGLDQPDDRPNHTTARDLARLARAIKETHPELFGILNLSEYDVTTVDGEVHHLKNTDELLGDPNLPGRVIGGKTGYTPSAKGCLVLVLAGPGQDAYTVNVILGSDDRFADMRSLVGWAYQHHSEPQESAAATNR